MPNSNIFFFFEKKNFQKFFFLISNFSFTGCLNSTITGCNNKVSKIVIKEKYLTKPFPRV